jgi:hypothetical protein
MTCQRFLEINDSYTSEECISFSIFRYYAIGDDETSFQLTPYANGIVWCNILHSQKYVTSNIGRNIDFFYYTSINWRIIKSKSKPAASLTPYADLLGECECPPDTCQVDCQSAPSGFCCIPHALTDRLLQVLQN